MNISITVGGRFHAFDLAEQLDKKNYLKQLITSYPKFYIKKNFNISQNKISSVHIKEIIQRSFLNKIYNFNDILTEYFDNKACTLLDFDNLDILIGWSGFSYNTFLKAKKKKCITILERGSTHIEYQNEIVSEEYSIKQLNPKLTSKFIIEKEKKEYEIADYIMVPTDYAKQTFLDKGFSKEKIIKNLYGVNLNDFTYKPKLTKNNKFQIIFTGAVSIRKGVLSLIEAFHELNLDNSQLLLIGKVDKELYSKLKKYKLNKNIKFKKPVAQKDLNEFYNNSNLFVLNSIEDGFGMVILQAMACGLPVIATKNSGGSEIIDSGEDGFIIPIRNKKILKEKILFLYNNPKILEEMGKKANKKVLNNFSWERYGQNAISIYQDLLKQQK